MKSRVLIVDDESAVRFTLSEILEDEALTVLEASDGQEALDILQAARAPIDLVVTDLQMPRMDGMSLLKAIREMGQQAPHVVMITAHGSERTAVEAMKSGALDYFKKPFKREEIVRVVRRCLRMTLLERENRRLRAEKVLGRTMLFSSPAMMHVAHMVERVAAKDVTVLISGASGVGKERVARALVEGSTRASENYVRFNCGALTSELAQAELFGHRKGAFTGASHDRRGLFREAHGGTLLLDEINSLDSTTQAMLLRVLQERQVRPIGHDRPTSIDVRMIATTNQTLEGHPDFRQDLYYRLNVVHIHVPPLCERREEIPALAKHFAQLYGQRFGLPEMTVSQATLDALQAAPWPGNVRELEHTIQSMAALASKPLLEGDPFASPLQTGSASSHEHAEEGLKARMMAVERKIIAKTLALCDNNQSEAARRLQINRVTLINKLKKHSLH